MLIITKETTKMITNVRNKYKSNFAKVFSRCSYNISFDESPPEKFSR